MQSSSFCRKELRSSLSANVILALSFLFAVSTSASWADSASDKLAAEKAEAEYVKKAFNEVCSPISSETYLGAKPNEGPALKTISPELLASLVTYKIDAKEVDQVRVRMSDGTQYFLVLKDSMSFKCDKPKELPGKIMHPVEPTTDIRMSVNPCCTYTYGSDATGKWYNLANCPLTRPKNLLKTQNQCGH